MGAIFFYHLTERQLEQVLPPLLEKARDAFGRVVVRGRDRSEMERLDLALWHGDGFLPHGLAGGPNDDAQPILLTFGDDRQAKDCLMAVHGAGVEAAEVSEAQRVCIIFNGHDTDQLATARAQWKTLTGAGLSAQYWADEGGWVKKAESG